MGRATRDAAHEIAATRLVDELLGQRGREPLAVVEQLAGEGREVCVMTVPDDPVGCVREPAALTQQPDVEVEILATGTRSPGAEIRVEATEVACDRCEQRGVRTRAEAARGVRVARIGLTSRAFVDEAAEPLRVSSELLQVPLRRRLELGRENEPGHARRRRRDERLDER